MGGGGAEAHTHDILLEGEIVCGSSHGLAVSDKPRSHARPLLLYYLQALRNRTVLWVIVMFVIVTIAKDWY